jgi:hypothetical protein
MKADIIQIGDARDTSRPTVHQTTRFPEDVKASAAAWSMISENGKYYGLLLFDIDYQQVLTYSMNRHALPYRPNL